jgi:hypothetical protein
MKLMSIEKINPKAGREKSKVIQADRAAKAKPVPNAVRPAGKPSGMPKKKSKGK